MYADTFNFLGNINIIQKVLEALLAAIKEDGLEVNAEKTEHMFNQVVGKTGI